MSAHHVIVHYAPPRAGSDGRITVERVGGTQQSRPATIGNIWWAAVYCDGAKQKGFVVDDAALERLIRNTPLKVKHIAPRNGGNGLTEITSAAGDLFAASGTPQDAAIARDYVRLARVFGFSVDDLALARVTARRVERKRGQN